MNCSPRRCSDLRAIRLALASLRLHQVESSWSNAGLLTPVEWSNVDDPEWVGGTVFTDDRRMVLAASPAACWPGVVGIGGNAGWYYGNWFWKLRGAMDCLTGRPGVPILNGPEPQPRTGQE